MNHILVTVTPELAAEYLKANPKNRIVRPSLVDQYANEMKMGRWKLTPQCMSIRTDGTISDGQHRLLAIVQSKTTQPMYVATGVPDDISDCLDIGAKRTAADYLSLHCGVKSAPAVAASVKAIASICCGFRSVRVSPTVAYDLSKHIQSELDALIPLLKPSKLFRHAWIIGALALAMKSNPSQVAVFAEKLVTGENLSAGDPALTFRKWMESQTSQYINANFKKPATEVLFMSLYHYIRGTRTTVLRRSTTGLDYFLFKQRVLVEKIWADIGGQL